MDRKLKKIKEYLYIIILLVIILAIVIGFWIFRESFIVSVKEFSVFYSFISTGIIAYITFLYFLSTKRIASKTAESVEASKKLSETTIRIEKDRLTYELIKEWHEDKKFLTSKRLRLGITRQSANLTFDIKNKEEFINYLDNFFDYFLRVYKLIDSGKINKDLYFKVLGQEIVKFKYDQLEENADISSDVRRILRNQKIDLPIISDREWFDKIFEIANEEYKFK